MIGIEEIKRTLPHRYPMLLVDRVVELVPGERLTALKAVSANEPWYGALSGDSKADHAYPPVLIIESWCQAAGILAAWQERNPDVLAGRVMLFGSIGDIRFRDRVLPGDLLEHHVRLVKSLKDATIVAGECLVAGSPVMEVGRVIMALRPADVLRREHAN